jgi:LuxR family maltose regulon positive regulatory protein
VIEARVLEALALAGRDDAGDAERALLALERALVLGDGEGYVRVFLDEGAPMETLLRRMERERGGSPYVVRLLEAFEAERARRRTRRPTEEAAAPQPLVEPLTDREMEVLEELAEGLTNREIGERLMVSLNTVKTHTKRIYGKLGVRNRTEAVIRAQELGLLEA